MAEKLSTASPYEQTFGTRHRRVGRPLGDTEPLFAVDDSVDPLLATVAKRRAQTVVLEECRSRLADVFAAELKVLRRRGVQEVARDVGVDLSKREEASHG